MPAPEVAALTGYAVLWTPSGTDNFGELVVSSPVEIRCRWEDSTGEKLDPLSGSVKSPASIAVAQVIPVGSLLWQGRLREVPSDPKDLRQVIMCQSIPDIKGRKYRRTVDVMVYSKSLPVVG